MSNMIYPSHSINEIIDENDLEERLSEIQGNILTPYGCDNVACLFITLDEVTARIKNWISKFSKRITTANLTPKTKEGKIKYNKENVTTNFHISHTSLNMLGISSSSFDSNFSHGMKNNPDIMLKDKQVKYWEKRYQKNLDILITFGSDSKEMLMLAVFEVYKELDSYLPEIANKFVEFGEWKYGCFGGEKHRVEPFGYRDGLSKVKFFQNDGKSLIPDRWRIALDQYGGSYLVFRKLEQDVPLFNKQIKELALALNISNELVEAQVVGRFKNGSPLTFSNDDGFIDSSNAIVNSFNNFNIEEEKQFDFTKSKDTAGKKCPFHAHIRKVNPREKEPLIKISYDINNKIPSRIVRRGIPFYNKEKEGMLFMCYQQNLRNHFLKIHKDWMNCSDFPPDSRLTGPDPFSNKIFENGKEIEKPKLYWNKEWDDKERNKTQFQFDSVIDFVGGEYFYTPNVKFLQNLFSDEEE